MCSSADEAKELVGFGEDALRLRNVAEHGGADDHVEVAVAEADRSAVSLLEGGVAQPGRELAGLGDEHRRGVDADRFGHPRPACQQLPHPPGADKEDQGMHTLGRRQTR